MRNILALVLLLALCIPAVADTDENMALPDMVGKWTGVMDVVVKDKNTAWMPNETVSFHTGGEYTMTIKEQKGKMFSGEMVPEMSPGSKEIVLGIFSSDNQSIAMVDEDGYLWGYMLSPTEVELSYQEVGPEGMVVTCGIFKKA